MNRLQPLVTSMELQDGKKKFSITSFFVEFGGDVKQQSITGLIKEDGTLRITPQDIQDNSADYNLFHSIAIERGGATEEIMKQIVKKIETKIEANLEGRLQRLPNTAQGDIQWIQWIHKSQ